MGLVLFLLTAAPELALAVFACQKAPTQKAWQKSRLIVRLLELTAVTVALLLPLGQRWRVVPALALLLVLALIAVLQLLWKRNRSAVQKKAGAIASCVLSVVLIAVALLPAFVFTGYSGLPASGSYPVRSAYAILVDANRSDPFETDGSSREVPAHFYYPETDGTERFPLIVFSHGAFGYYQSNVSTYLELASNGYVVVSLDHPHHAFFTEDTDGKTVTVDPTFLNDALSLSSETDAETQYALYTEWMALRTADMGFALDAIKDAAHSGATDACWFFPENAEPVTAALDKIDPDRVGLMGHSMGGATSVALGKTRDDIGAVVDLDGTMLSEYTGVTDGTLTVRSEPYSVPLLAFNNWESYRERNAFLAQGGVYPDDELLKNAKSGYSVTVRDTAHMDFTDLPLLSPFLGRLLGSGERDTAETLTLVNSLVLRFFDHYLKEKGDFTANEVY